MNLKVSIYVLSIILSRGVALSEVQYSQFLRFDGNKLKDEFGWSVSGAGDVNGDGVPDVIIGARQEDAFGNSGNGLDTQYRVLGM
jgi:hypothetical protein